MTYHAPSSGAGNLSGTQKMCFLSSLLTDYLLGWKQNVTHGTQGIYDIVGKAKVLPTKDIQLCITRKDKYLANRMIPSAMSVGRK